jgi:hypothetical protein
MYPINSDIKSYTVTGSLMDGGGNGSLAGEDIAILSICEHSKVDVTSISNTIILDMTLAQVAAVITTQSGQKISAIIHQYANLGMGRSIHSIGQLEKFGMKINARAKYLGGTQQLVTPEGHVIPFSIQDG